MDAKQRRKFRRAVERSVPQIVPDTFTPPTPAPAKLFRHRLLDFIEHPLFLTPVGIIGGLVGLFFYTPILIICGACVLLAFHRAKVVSSYPRLKPAYGFLAGLTFLGLYGIRVLVNPKLTHPTLEQPAFTERGATVMHFDFAGGLMSLERTADELRNHRVTNDANIDGVVFPVTVYAEGDTLYVDVKLEDQAGKDAIELRKNEFTVEADGWDKNSNANALEVVNKVGQVIFQLVRGSKTEMNLNGVFRGDEGLVCFDDKKVGIRPVKSPADCLIAPVFKYPSWKYPGKYADGSNW